jgi:hypothetical protein
VTREAVARLLGEMEQIRMDSYEADTPAEEHRLTAEYARLWKVVEPYVNGKRTYSEPRPV